MVAIGPEQTKGAHGLTETEIVGCWHCLSVGRLSAVWIYIFCSVDKVCTRHKAEVRYRCERTFRGVLWSAGAQHDLCAAEDATHGTHILIKLIGQPYDCYFMNMFYYDVDRRIIWWCRWRSVRCLTIPWRALAPFMFAFLQHAGNGWTRICTTMSFCLSLIAYTIVYIWNCCDGRMNMRVEFGQSLCAVCTTERHARKLNAWDLMVNYN